MATEAAQPPVEAAEPVADAPAEEAPAEKPVEKEEAAPVSIYDEELPNRIIVGRTRPLSFYVDRSRRVFRVNEEVYVQGRGENIATTCKLIEALKRQKIASVTKVSTNMDVEPYFNSYGDAKWGRPTAVIIFKLQRGEFGKYIADFQQRKVIEIFETADEKSEGVLPLEKVESMQLETKFRANEEQVKQGKDFLASQKAKELNLPEFIKYASILIHPLLKPKVFKEILTKEFNMDVGQGNANAAPKENEAQQAQ